MLQQRNLRSTRKCEIAPELTTTIPATADAVRFVSKVFSFDFWERANLLFAHFSCAFSCTVKDTSLRCGCKNKRLSSMCYEPDTHTHTRATTISISKCGHIIPALSEIEYSSSSVCKRKKLEYCYVSKYRSNKRHRESTKWKRPSKTCSQLHYKLY